MSIIKSSIDLRNSYNDISTFCHNTNEPLFITKNGRGDFSNGHTLGFEESMESLREGLNAGTL